MFSVGEKQSATRPDLCSVSRSSVLGPVQFISYIDVITTVFDKHDIKRHHMFSDDKQMRTSVAVADVSAAKSNTEPCVADVQAWCASRRLQLNRSKTEVI